MYFDDINDASERIWDMLENFKEVVEALETTNESVLSHQLNDVLRVLTSITVIVLPLTLIASVFGMNVHVPWEGESEGFWITVGAMVALLRRAWSGRSAGAASCSRRLCRRQQCARTPPGLTVTPAVHPRRTVVAAEALERADARRRSR